MILLLLIFFLIYIDNCSNINSVFKFPDPPEPLPPAPLTYSDGVSVAFVVDAEPPEPLVGGAARVPVLHPEVRCRGNDKKHQGSQAAEGAPSRQSVEHRGEAVGSSVLLSIQQLVGRQKWFKPSLNLIDCYFPVLSATVASPRVTVEKRPNTNHNISPVSFVVSENPQESDLISMLLGDSHAVEPKFWMTMSLPIRHFGAFVRL